MRSAILGDDVRRMPLRWSTWHRSCRSSCPPTTRSPTSKGRCARSSRGCARLAVRSRSSSSRTDPPMPPPRSPNDWLAVTIPCARSQIANRTTDARCAPDSSPPRVTSSSTSMSTTTTWRSSMRRCRGCSQPMGRRSSSDRNAVRVRMTPAHHCVEESPSSSRRSSRSGSVSRSPTPTVSKGCDERHCFHSSRTADSALTCSTPS